MSETFAGAATSHFAPQQTEPTTETAMKRFTDESTKPSNDALANPSRRDFIKRSAAAAAVVAAGPTLISRYAHATTGRPVKIGFVSPRTGPLAAFGEADEFVLGGVRKLVANGLLINGTTHPIQILERDSRSDPNRAAEVTSALIKTDTVDLIVTSDTPETTNPVADQAEINGVPCLTTVAPWQAYFFGRDGRPDQGFDWTYHFFWGLEDVIAVFTAMWASIPTNKVVGALWGNDNDGNAFGDAKLGFPPALQAKGFTLVDYGRFEPMTNDYSAQIRKFKDANVEIVTGVLPPPAFSTFWTQAAQQGFKPKIATVAKALLFPTAVTALSGRGTNLSTEVWWTPNHPFKSSLTGQSAAEFCGQFEHDTKKQWTQPTGFKHALFEIAFDTLKRTKNINSPAAVRDALAATKLDTIVGPVQWTGKPVKNVCRTPLVGGQWVPGKKYKYDLLVVNNENYAAIPKLGSLHPIA
jgi:branched-chain amino acid transport system substrate-binding protein